MCTCEAIVVLLVGDDTSFRNGVAANLVHDGHLVYECARPADVTTAHIAAANVVVTDPVIKDTDGVAFAVDLHDAHPDLAILLLATYWTVEVETIVVTRPYIHLGRKPVDYDELHAWIHELTVAA